MWTCQWSWPWPPQTTSPFVTVSLVEPSGSPKRCETRQRPRLSRADGVDDERPDADVATIAAVNWT